MADITLTYKGNTIAELSESGSKTIETAGKYCEADIGLTYVKPAGGNSTLSKKVRFLDYDGTVVATKTPEEIQAMSTDADLPAAPVHQGLTAQGWNWTLAQLKTDVPNIVENEINVMQMYVPTDGKTEIYISLTNENALSPYLALAVNGTVSVDWGDGSAFDSMTGSSNTVLVFQQHVYSTVGNYVIRIGAVNGTYAFYAANMTYPSFLRCSNENTNLAKELTYMVAVTDVRIGNNAIIGQYAFVNCVSTRIITIPSGITTIGNYAFSSCYSLTSIVFPAELTSIGIEALGACHSLKFISIPTGVTSISDYAFQLCASLSLISIPSTVTAIGKYAFSNCGSLVSVTIPNGVKSISSYLFSNCHALTFVSIPSTVKSLGSYAFQYCYALKSITIPSQVTEIPNYFLTSCLSLKTVTLSDGIKTIGDSAFQGNVNLTSINLPSTVTNIKTTAFANCKLLTSITIPSGVTTINQTVFSACYSLKSVVLSEGVKTISNQSFKACHSLITITLPSTMTSISGQPFTECYALKELHIKATTPPTLSASSCLNDLSEDLVIYVPASSVNTYKTANYWSNYASKIQAEPT